MPAPVTAPVRSAWFIDPGYEYDQNLGCLPCEKGSYKPAAGDTRCISCPGYPHAFTEGTGATDLAQCQCALGFVNVTVSTGTANETSCVCASGRYYDDRADTCSSCLLDHYKPDSGMTSCAACLATRTIPFSGSVSADDCVCREATYVNEKDPTGDCLACPYCGDCQGKDAMPVASEGCFSSSAQANVFVKCATAEACKGGDVCAKVSAALTLVRRGESSPASSHLAFSCLRLLCWVLVGLHW